MKNEKRKILQGLAYVFAVVGAAAVIYGLLFSGSPNGLTRPVAAQQDPFLAQRLTQIESRFNNIESRLNRIESDVRLSAITPRTTENNDAEIRLLRSQLDTLLLRLETLECGLVKLDERTLTSAARQALRKSAGGATDRCRLEPNAPLQIIGRGTE
jgi:hypothetical protein